MLGERQRQILTLLSERGGALCVEVLVRELAPDDRRAVQRALERLAADGLVGITGRRGKKGLAAAVVELAAAVLTDRWCLDRPAPAPASPA